MCVRAHAHACVRVCAISVGDGKDIPGRGNTICSSLERAQHVLGTGE